MVRDMRRTAEPAQTVAVPLAPTGTRVLRETHGEATLGDEAIGAETIGAAAVRSFLLVVLFWWFATGAIFTLERNEATRTIGLVLATVLALWGAWTLYVERNGATAASARAAFLGAAFLWTWVQVGFYGGWIIGPASLRVPVPAEPASIELAVRAVVAMLWYQLTMLAVLGYAGWCVGNQRNRIGWWALLLFWCEHQVASINIFVGVENPGRGFFPDALVFLESYFGPQRNSWLLPVSIAAVLIFTLRIGVRAIREQRAVRRQAFMLLTVLGALGVLELAVLGTPMQMLLWDWAREVRGY